MEEEGGDDDLFLTEDNKRLRIVEALPPSLPHEERYHLLVNPEARSTKIDNTGLHKNVGETLSVGVALRELVQNLIDQAARSNGQLPSFNGIKITRGTRRRNAEEAFVLHNDTHKLAEIIHDRSPLSKEFQHFDAEKKHTRKTSFGTLSFINYGPTIMSVTTLTATGNSDKQGMVNQVGQFGEGLKRAICRFLTVGCGVDIFVPIIDERPVFHRLRFYIVAPKGNREDMVFYKTSVLKPKAVHPNNPFDDTNHIEILITYPKKELVNYKGFRINGFPDGLGLDLYANLVPREYFRNIQDVNDKGTILFDSDLRNKFYVYHFFVFSPDKVKEEKLAHWGYDFFCPITRDRNQLPLDTIVKSMAAVWSRYIVEHDINDKYVIAFYTSIVLANSDYKPYETLCLGHLTKSACLKLVALYKYRNPDTYPVLQKNLHHAKSKLKQNVSVVPDNASTVFFRFEGGFESFDVYTQKLADDLSLKESLGVPVVPIELINMFPSCIFKLRPDNVMYFALSGGLLIINWALLLDKTLAKATHQILQVATSTTNYNPDSLVENMLSVFRQRTVLPPPEVPPLTCEEEDEVFVENNNNRPQKKRDRTVASSSPPPPPVPSTQDNKSLNLVVVQNSVSREQLGPPPPGMKFIYTWCLVKDN